MKQMWSILLGMGMASVFAGTPAQFVDSTCASPKLSPVNICDTLNTLTDSSRLFIYVILPPPMPDSESTPAYKAKVKVWSESLFTEYDLRTFQYPMTRLPVPPDSELHWGYGMIMTTKATVLALVNESYVHRLEVQTSPGSTSIYSRNTGPVNREKKPVGVRIDALGRDIMRKNRSMNSFFRPPPKH